MIFGFVRVSGFNKFTGFSGRPQTTSGNLSAPSMLPQDMEEQADELAEGRQICSSLSGFDRTHTHTHVRNKYINLFI